MATYTPIVFIGPSQDLSSAATTYYSLAASTTAIVRTIHAQGNSASITLTVGMGGAEAANKRIIDGFALTANVPYTLNGWWVNGTASASAIYATSTATAASKAVGNISGYTYA